MRNICLDCRSTSIVGVENDHARARLQGQSIFVIDVFRKRMRFPELERTAIDLARTHRAATLLIEDAASGTQLLDTLRAGAPAKVPAPIPRKPEGDKISRALGVSSMVQSGRLFLPKQAYGHQHQG